MESLFALSTALVLLLVFFALLNTFTLRRITIEHGRTIDARVSVLIPLRNESENVDGVVQSALEQTGLPNFEVLALDDASTDDTLNLLERFSPSHLKVLQGALLEPDWLGKNFACYQLSQHASGEYLVFVDADVRLHPEAIVSSIHYMKRWGWDFLSPYPRQIAISFLERLVQPLLQWSWFVSLPLRLAATLKRPSMVVANGQFFIVRKDAYLATGGHSAIKSEVLDDLELARTLVRAGFKGGVADGSHVAQCRMYSTSRELIEGYTKSQWRAFGNPVGALIAIALLFLTSIFPFAYGLTGEITGWYIYFAVVFTRILSGLMTRSVLSSAILHPLSALAWILLIAHSWYRKLRGTLMWRGRAL